MPVQPSAASIDFLACRARILCDAAGSGGRLGVVEMEVPPGDASPLHVHRAEDEGFYVIEGKVTVYLPGEQVTLGPGDFFLAPRDVPHAYEAGDTPGRWLVMSTPAGFESFVAEVGGAAAAGPLEPPAIGALAAAHDIEILGPPGTRP